MLFNPKQASFDHLDARSREIMQKTIDFFETKGKQKLKEDDHERVWYDDFLQFVKKEKIFFDLLTPTPYGKENCRWDTFRNMDFNEILGFYSLSYWYTWQVTILGLGPIWMGDNEAVKSQTAKLLEEGGIFAFGLSEKAHGADLYASDMALTPMGDGQYRADGGKYYIGNANKAALVSTFAKNSETDEYVFFVADSQHENYEWSKTWSIRRCYVAEYALNGYPITDDDILTTGSRAWDSS
jgi:acyl-CoA dehydrogenase